MELHFGDSKMAIAVTLILILVLYLLFMRKKYRLPPGPMPLPVIGNVLSFRGVPRQFEKITELRKTYGDILTMKIGMARFVFLSNVDLIRESFAEKEFDVAGRPKLTLMQAISDEGKNISFSDPTPEWTLLRKVALGALRKYASGKHLEEIVYFSVDQITEEMKKQKEPFYPLDLTTLLVYNVIMGICFGKSYELKDPEFRDLYETVEQGNKTFGKGMLGDFIPIIRYLPQSDALKKAVSIIRKAQGYLQRNVAEHRKNYNLDSKAENLMDHIIETQLETEAEEGKAVMQILTTAHFNNIIDDVFFAGTDTSRGTLTWILALMAGHPNVQAKMHKQLDEVVGRVRRISLADKERLPYVEAIIMETMRFRPVAAFSLPHAATCDTTIGGYDIPKGTMVMGNVWALNMDANNWHEPHKFKPERFLDENGQLGPRPAYFIPFLIGKRKCIGEILAKNQLFLSTAILFQRFRFTPVPMEKLQFEMQAHPFSALAASYNIMAYSRQ